MSAKFSHIALSERKILLRVLDAFSIVFSLWLSQLFLNINYIDFHSNNIYTWLITLIFYFYLFGQIFELYNLQVASNQYRVIRSLFITAFITTLFFTFTPYFSPSLPSDRIEIIYLFLCMLFPVLIWRFMYILLLFRPKYFKDIVMVGRSDRLINLLPLIKEQRFHNVAAYVSDEPIEGFDRFESIKTVDIYKIVKSRLATEVIISTTGFSSDLISRINKDVVTLFEEGINIKSYESFYQELTDRVPKEYLDYKFYKNINLSKNLDNKLYLFIHRVMDILIALIGLVFFVPFLPIIFLINLFANRGPLFYTQERVGKRGESFKIYKLRSMIPNAEKNGAVYAIKNDKRITFFGKFLRNTRLDEAPQFFNILIGDMSLIGPRPERPEFVKDLEDKLPFYAIRHVVKPGLTGWAQVRYPYAGTLEEQETKLRYDLYYIKERNLFLDFKIIIKTITTVLFFKGQ